ncbi:sigma-70 family RNA polymerase sigma factor [Desulfosporosinus sp. PR]|uniref:sigma-70 family RNA polymerase sigma factor n=1 Tax=Candidatus Desulfosporosinus nitrosoreducens TaxID=3401928 RepID=UPI0027EDB011|nr:sigma-70 family RNA polymerase sigma factor [Desulfosporosinus sp. PR]MDQ7093189.1 sigma-70 family RNA polymerase sigma factor [Desulfosporosinus sp. PR]
MEEKEMLAGLLNHDQAALKSLMNAYITDVYSLSSAIIGGVGSAEDIEECSSDVFFTAWKSIDKYSPDRAGLRTWVLMICKFVALDRRRNLKTKISQLPLAEEAIPAKILTTSFETVEERQELQTALKSLARQERELIYRRYFLDESINDLASAYGLTRQAVDNKLWRARKLLKNLLGKKERQGVEEL